MRIELRTTETNIPRGRCTQLLVDGVETWAETWLEQLGSPGPRVGDALARILEREPTEDELDRLDLDRALEVA